MFDILVLPSPVDISPLLTKSAAAVDAKPKGSVEVFLVITNNVTKLDKEGNVEVIKANDKNSVKVVTYDLVSEKVRVCFYSVACAIMDHNSCMDGNMGCVWLLLSTSVVFSRFWQGICEVFVIFSFSSDQGFFWFVRPRPDLS